MMKNKPQESNYGTFEWSEDDVKEFAKHIEAPPLPNEELQKAVSEYIKRERFKSKKNKK